MVFHKPETEVWWLSFWMSFCFFVCLFFFTFPQINAIFTVVKLWSDAKCTLWWLYLNMNICLKFPNCVQFASAVLWDLLTLYHITCLNVWPAMMIVRQVGGSKLLCLGFFCLHFLNVLLGYRCLVGHDTLYNLLPCRPQSLSDVTSKSYKMSWVTNSGYKPLLYCVFHGS